MGVDVRQRKYTDKVIKIEDAPQFWLDDRALGVEEIGHVAYQTQYFDVVYVRNLDTIGFDLEHIKAKLNFTIRLFIPVQNFLKAALLFNKPVEFL